MTQELPLVTLITVVRNGAATIGKMLESVKRQTYPNIEYIVIDGASTDGTLEILSQYRDIITVLQSKSDKGAYDAQAQAFALAKGEIIGFIWADDWLEPDAVETIVDMYRKEPDAEMFCFGMQVHEPASSGGYRKERYYCDPPGERLDLESGVYCQGLTRFYHRSIMQRHGFYKADLYPQMADRDLYMRISLGHPRKVQTRKVLHNMLKHPDSNSGGGSRIKNIQLLAETLHIAEDYLRNPNLSAQEQRCIREWFCFSTLRLAYFRICERQLGVACGELVAALVRFPMAFIRKTLFYKMPRGYRGAWI